LKTCKEILALLWDRHFQSAELQEEIDMHLDACPPCNSEAGKIEQTRVALKSLSETPSQSFDARLSDAIQVERESAAVIKTSSAFWKRPLLIMATGAAAVFVFALLSGSPFEEKELAELPTPLSAQSETGLLADREWQDSDSLERNDEILDPSQNLKAVSAKP
jgi:hypothetical protein